ncbi:MAG: hypothetical protein ABL927_07750 [Bdellovibrionales bacterium]
MMTALSSLSVLFVAASGIIVLVVTFLLMLAAGSCLAVSSLIQAVEGFYDENLDSAEYDDTNQNIFTVPPSLRLRKNFSNSVDSSEQIRPAS